MPECFVTPHMPVTDIQKGQFCPFLFESEQPLLNKLQIQYDSFKMANIKLRKIFSEYLTIIHQSGDE